MNTGFTALLRLNNATDFNASSCFEEHCADI